MMQGDGLVQLREIDALLNLTAGTCAQLRKKGVFYAHKLRTRLWAVDERDLATVIDRILRYRSRRPWDPIRNMTVAEIAEVMGISMAGVYAMLNRGDLVRAEGEHWTSATKESVNRLLRLRGRREVA